VVSVCMFVRLIFCLLDQTVSPATMAEPIEMPFGMLTWVSPKNHPRWVQYPREIGTGTFWWMTLGFSHMRMSNVLNF